MPLALEAALTVVGNIGGYALAALVVIVVVRRSGSRDWIAGFPKAASALFVLWCITLAWYVVTEYWLGDYTVNRHPDWLESSNGIAENIQSEVFQVWLAALVFKYLRWPGSPESE